MLRRTTLAVLLALALIAAACSTGGTPQAEGPSAAALTPTSVAPSVATAPTGSDTTSEGINVHGHWTIEVRDSDGSIAERREFENALQETGEEFLAGMAVGIFVDPRDWRIVLVGAPGNPTFPATASMFLDDNGYGFFLRGSTMYSTDVVLDAAATFVRYTQTPTGLDVSRQFTGVEIPPVNVAANQSVYVTVEISFS